MCVAPFFSFAAALGGGGVPFSTEDWEEEDGSIQLLLAYST